ncbi:MAG TPA: DeoR family transcriptional regulator, partial [Candidatus Methylacidiphilales bacterium]|nr:DeoR family transcriptional regulator [Candidatus Methylacidiphilales bacterium]
MFAQERLNRIRKLVRRHRRMTFAEVQKQVAVSPATLRRDLAELEQAGDLIRVHGGILDPSYARAEVSFDERVVRQRAAKLAIAQAAA